MKNNIIEIHWICESPSPYNRHLFGAISSDKKYNLLVHYRNINKNSHPWRDNLVNNHKNRQLNNTFLVDVKILLLFFRSVTSSSKHSLFFIAGWNHATSVIILMLLSLFDSNFVIWTDTPNNYINRSGLLQLFRRKFLKWVFNSANCVMGTGSPAINALSIMGVAKHKLINFPYWIDTQKYYNKPRRLSGKRKVIFFSSGVLDNHRKGYDYTITALADTMIKTGCDFEYRIAGIGKDKENIIGLSSKLGIGEKIVLLGWLDSDELINEFKGSDVFIHSPPNHEPYGVSVIEAMASGSLVIASDLTCAALDRIENGNNGIIYKARDNHELSNIFSKVLIEPEIIYELGSSALVTANNWKLERSVRIIDKVVDRFTDFK